MADNFGPICTVEKDRKNMESMNIRSKRDWQISKEEENFTSVESWNKGYDFTYDARNLHREKISKSDHSERDCLTIFESETVSSAIRGAGLRSSR